MLVEDFQQSREIHCCVGSMSSVSNIFLQWPASLNIASGGDKDLDALGSDPQTPTKGPIKALESPTPAPVKPGRHNWNIASLTVRCYLFSTLFKYLLGTKPLLTSE
eukprot:Gb_02485 [translate_table: standard]